MFSCDLSGAYSKLAGEKLDKALECACQQVLEDSNKFIHVYRKRSTGNLASSGHVEGKSIVWKTPYARRVYYSSQRGSKHWFQQAKAVNAKKWTKSIASKMEI